MHHNGGLPPPDAAALAHSRRVTETLRTEIAAHGGDIGFDRFMEIALYASGLGYYSAGTRKLGADGDFVTAPEISPLFSHCVAAQCAQVLEHLDGGVILEIGAGSGAMACDLLVELARRGVLPDAYLILEVSAELRGRQESRVRASIPLLAHRVRWLDSLPEPPLRGVVIANEVLDAMPVVRFRMHDGVPLEMAVADSDSGLCWVPRPMQWSLDTALMPLLRDCPEGYVSEWRPMQAGWIHSLASILAEGTILLVDYGYPRREYYHPQRVDGTLRCFYRHRAHDDPFLWPGLQDITAGVDFSAVMEAAHAAGLATAGYTSQAGFLIGCGLEGMVAGLADAGTAERTKLSRQVQVLTLPGEMGEIVKAMALTRSVNIPLIGFSGSDHRHRL
jgi:SAM-dependent MidA family methyltransferase